MFKSRKKVTHYNKMKLSKATVATISMIFAIMSVFFAMALFGYGDDDSDSVEITVAQSDQPLYDFSGDAILFVEAVEAVHAIFVLDGVLSEYYQDVRAEYLGATAQPMTLTDFAWATQRFITILQDGHMSFVPLIRGHYLNINWKATDQGLFLLGRYGDISENQVIEIGGVAVDEIFALIDIHFFPENHVARLMNYATFSRFEPLLELSGSNIINSRLVDLTLVNERGAETLRVHFAANSGHWRLPPLPTARNYIIRYEMLYDDIAFIDLRSFVHHPEIDSAVVFIEQAIADGIRKFIVDLRGNGGGSSHVGESLLNAMGVTPPGVGFIRRLSELFLERALVWPDDVEEPADAEEMMEFLREYVYAIDGVEFFISTGGEVGILTASNTETANNPNDVFISVLTDNATFGAAMMFAGWVQDGGLGNIVGEPSINAPSLFGEMLPLHLPISDFHIPISSSFFYARRHECRPNNPLAGYYGKRRRCLKCCAGVFAGNERIEPQPQISGFWSL